MYCPNQHPELQTEFLSLNITARKKNNFQMPSAAKKDPIIIMNVEIKIENDQTKPSELFRSEPNKKKKKS